MSQEHSEAYSATELPVFTGVDLSKPSQVTLQQNLFKEQKSCFRGRYDLNCMLLFKCYEGSPEWLAETQKSASQDGIQFKVMILKFTGLNVGAYTLALVSILLLLVEFYEILSSESRRVIHLTSHEENTGKYC